MAALRSRPGAAFTTTWRTVPPVAAAVEPFEAPLADRLIPAPAILDDLLRTAPPLLGVWFVLLLAFGSRYRSQSPTNGATAPASPAGGREADLRVASRPVVVLFIFVVVFVLVLVFLLVLVLPVFIAVVVIIVVRTARGRGSMPALSAVGHCRGPARRGRQWRCWRRGIFTRAWRRARRSVSGLCGDVNGAPVGNGTGDKASVATREGEFAAAPPDEPPTAWAPAG
jgi:hypothetical protein